MKGASRSKYQFFITYRNAITASAASKPLLDTKETLSALGYKDCSLAFDNDRKTVGYYVSVLTNFLKFFFKLDRGSLVATQYPIPTVGYLFIYFIRLAAFKGVKFITIIHDINSLRSEKPSTKDLRKELRMLSAYDGIVVHNNRMKEWLIEKGLNRLTKTVSLNFFDYISATAIKSKYSSGSTNEIAFAGHLAKSTFVYNLAHVKKWKFNVYGTGFQPGHNKNVNTTWKGEFSPDEIVDNLKGSFGLVWDGADSNSITTNTFGNYMRYNNPFKFSLYLAAGLPVIAPSSAAIANTIIENKIGLVIETLDSLDNIEIKERDYEEMRENVKAIQKDIIKGNYLRKAIENLEQVI